MIQTYIFYIIIPMSSPALLVDCHKIINWLEDRKKLRKDWYNYLKAGQEKLKTLLKDREWTINYPNLHDHITQHQHSFNYLNVSTFVQLLLQTDLAQQKNMLFGYGDKRVKEWTTLKKYMEGNSLNLLSLAKFIEQSLRFDLPGLSKSVENFDNQLATLKRKIDFNNNTIFQQKTAIAKEKGLLGIESEEEKELPIEALIERIIGRGPQQIRHLQEQIKSNEIKKYVEDYNAINSQNQLPNQLETLQYFIKNGDEFLQIFKDPSKKQQFQTIIKYKDFQNWKGSNEWQIVIEGEQRKQQKITDKSTVIQNRQFRQRLLYDLSQLLFFYKGMKYELSESKGIGIQSQISKHSSIVQGDTTNAINDLQRVIAFLTSKRLTAPLQLKNSKKAYQVLVGHFLGYEANINTMNSQIRSYNQQISELQMKRQQQAEKLNWLRNKVVGCKAKCQNLLTELVKKQVRITGQINKLE